ncbi:TetR/AcrR family transcriptional regulator C-terminal domain-containing protein [Actinoplanes sp. NPDC051851]|uniref:TetR/AcrR family transcriptional regulator n=1 Tax=Actinoplanes sp. NPDC051851 TaxID=3154753 RepID=UPI0034178740
MAKRERGSLTRSEIVKVALELAEAEGGEALTFRRLGPALGVAPTAVLRHFRDKDELLLAIGNQLLETALAEVDPAEPDWRERIRALSRATRRAFVAHPRVAVLVATRTLRQEAEFRVVELILGAMAQAGLRGREAASLYRVVADTLLAWTAFEATVHAVGLDVMRKDGLAWDREYVVLPADRYPRIREVAPYLSEVDREDQFELALELVLDAVAARGSAGRVD